MQKDLIIIYIPHLFTLYYVCLEHNIIIRWEQYEQHLKKIFKPSQKLMISSTSLPHQYVDGSTI
jgi:hypothetical protein